MHFLIFLIEIFYVPLLAFLAKSNLTHFQCAEQSEYVFNRSLNAIIFVIKIWPLNQWLWIGHGYVACWKKPNTFCLQLCILPKYYSVQKLHHNSKTINLIRTLSDTHFTTGKGFSTKFSPRFYSIPQLIWKVSFLLISSFLLELQDWYASWQWTSLSCMHSSASAHSLLPRRITLSSHRMGAPQQSIHSKSPNCDVLWGHPQTALLG